MRSVADHLLIACTQVSKDAPKTSGRASTPPSVDGDVHVGDFSGDSEASGVAADDAIVGSLIGADDTEPPRGGGEAARVPSPEEGLNLWEPEGEGREATAPRDMASMQVTAVAWTALLRGVAVLVFTSFCLRRSSSFCIVKWLASALRLYSGRGAVLLVSGKGWEKKRLTVVLALK